MTITFTNPLVPPDTVRVTFPDNLVAGLIAALQQQMPNAAPQPIRRPVRPRTFSEYSSKRTAKKK